MVRGRKGGREEGREGERERGREGERERGRGVRESGEGGILVILAASSGEAIERGVRPSLSFRRMLAPFSIRRRAMSSCSL